MVVLVILILASSTLAGPAGAQDQRGVKRPYPPGLSEARLMRQRAEALGLGEELQAKLNTLIEEAESTGEKLREESGEAVQGLHKLLNEPLPDEKALLGAGRAAGEVAKRMREHQLRTTLRARGLLTEEQLAKFMDIRSRVTVPRQGGGKVRR
jgi:Spy/CpxP family protein refolding chaperone